nr:hypothetical protein [uncultured Romboutsia sp.]
MYDKSSTVSGMESMELPFDEITEIKIKISGDAKLFDVGVSKLKHWLQ